MKYNSSNKPLVCMQTQSTCYKGTRTMTVKGVLWHSTGANNPMLKRYIQPSDTKPAADTYSKAKWLEVLGKNTYANDWNHINREAGLNCWIGKLADGTVTTVQTMPWDYRPWGCGSGSKGSCNTGWIQFEICEDGLTDKNYFNKVYQEACEITAYLCKMYNIDPHGSVTVDGVKVPTILCHQDSYKLGMGGNHSDIYHWFPKHGKNMETARADVAAILKAAGGTTTVQPATKVKTYKVVTPVNKYSTSADAAAQKNAKSDKLAAGTYYILAKYPDGVNGMFNLTTDPKGAEAGSWINPKENVIAESQTTTQTLYRVRKSWDDAKSQVGAYKSLTNAINSAKANPGYSVFDDKGNCVYDGTKTEEPKKEEIKTYTVTYRGNGGLWKNTDVWSNKATLNVEYYIEPNFFERAGYKFVGWSENPNSKDPSWQGWEGKKWCWTYERDVTLYALWEAISNTEEKQPEVQEDTKPEANNTPVYDLDYPEKTLIVNRSITRTNKDCVKAIKAILKNNKDFDIEIAKAFFKLGSTYGIDPMMAISQSILETGWFKYQGSAVKPEQHNYCGLGVTSNGVEGGKFDTIDDGVTAQYQHLYAYGTKEALDPDEKILDPRFKYVTRGIAPYWQNLAGRWAVPGYDKAKYDTPQKAMEAGNTYGQKILTLFKSVEATLVTDEDVEKYFLVEKPEEPSKPEEPKVEDPKVEAPVETDKTPENPETPESPEVTDTPNGEDKATDIASLIFSILKKLIQMLANVFSKGE